ncbi:hypothetical protein HK101_000233, partial [Irineochytrium annulatum]
QLVGPPPPPLPKAGWSITSKGGVVPASAPRQPVDPGLAMVPCCAVRDTNTERASYLNYFVESPFDDHQDIRYMQVITPGRRRKNLVEALDAWTRFCEKEGITAWLAYGGLVGWFWNQKMLPWDVDLDFHVSLATLRSLRRFDNHLIGRRYLLEVNGYSAYRLEQSGNNIDARLTDTMSGFYIDIFAMADVDGTNGTVVRQKMELDFQVQDIFPLRSTTLMGFPVWRPNAVVKILRNIYGVAPLVDTQYRDKMDVSWRWNQHTLRWEKTWEGWLRGLWPEIRAVTFTFQTLFKKWMLLLNEIESDKAKTFQQIKDDMEQIAEVPREKLNQASEQAAPPCETFTKSQLNTLRAGRNLEDVVAMAPLYANASKNIYFVSPYQTMSYVEELCSIESARTHNPDRKITLYTNSPEYFTEVLDFIIEQKGFGNPDAALSASRMKAEVVVNNLSEEFMQAIQQTPLQRPFETYLEQNTELPAELIVAAFQLGLLYRNGGTAIGLDVVSLAPLGAGIGLDGARPLMEYFMTYDQGDEMAWALMKKLGPMATM